MRLAKKLIKSDFAYFLDMLENSFYKKTTDPSKLNVALTPKKYFHVNLKGPAYGPFTKTLRITLIASSDAVRVEFIFNEDGDLLGHR